MDVTGGGIVKTKGFAEIAGTDERQFRLGLHFRF
jgi:hypothetical protein